MARAVANRQRRSERRVRSIGSVASEFKSAELGDARMTKRLVEVAEACSAASDHSFPDMVEGKAELDGLYRFASNERVDPQAVLAPHAKATAARCREVSRVVVAHDTTECVFSSEVEREGLVPLGGKNRRGFLLHASVALGLDGVPRPLGVLHAAPWVRTERRKRSKAKQADGVKESARWGDAVRATRELLGEGVTAIHVMDREGDAYPSLAAMVEGGDHFVVRAAQDRVVLSDGDRLLLREAVDRAEAVFDLEATLSKRREGKTPYQKTFPPRDRRVAQLCFSAKKLKVKRPKNVRVGGLPPEIEVNVVRVWEPDPPEGVEAVEWYLLTSEAIDSSKAIQTVVELYRARWVVEEFFKALKTGCAYETRQLTTYHALLVALMVFLPVACRLLSLRSLLHRLPNASATLALTRLEIDVLREFSTRVDVPADPTIEVALRAIAGLGGHLKHNGRPGWLTLARGMEKLMSLVAGWEAALAAQAKRCGTASARPG